MAAVTGFFHGGITVSDMDRSLAVLPRRARPRAGVRPDPRRAVSQDGPGPRVRPHPGGLPATSPAGASSSCSSTSASSDCPAASRPCDYGAGHLCLYVDDVEAMHARLVGSGFAARSESVVEITAGPNQGARELLHGRSRRLRRRAVPEAPRRLTAAARSPARQRGGHAMRRPIDTLAERPRSPGGPGHPARRPDRHGRDLHQQDRRLVRGARDPRLRADCGGGPNACMLGSDGAVYITQNGGTVGAWRAEVMGRPSIQKAWPDGRVEEVAARGRRRRAPGAQRPDVRARRAAVLHRSRRLPARRPQARRACSSSSRTARASCWRSCRPRTRTASSPSPTGRSCGSSRTSAASTASDPARPSEQIAQLARRPHPGRPQDRRQRRPVGDRLHGRRRRHPGPGRDATRTSSRRVACRSTASSMDGALVHHRLRRHHRGDGRCADGRPAVAGRRRGRRAAAVPRRHHAAVLAAVSRRVQAHPGWTTASPAGRGGPGSTSLHRRQRSAR